MGSFKTTDGAAWTVAVNVGTVKRVREATGIELLSIVSDGSTIASLFADCVKLAEVVAAVIAPELKAAGKTVDDFLSVIDGSVMEVATEALLREVANFSREPQRTLLLRAIDKVMAEAAKNEAVGAAAALEALDRMEVAASSTSIPTNSVSSLPASVA